MLDKLGCREEEDFKQGDVRSCHEKAVETGTDPFIFSLLSRSDTGADRKTTWCVTGTGLQTGKKDLKADADMDE